MRGRNRKPVATLKGVITKKEREARLAQEKGLRLETDKLTPPDWLDDIGKAVFVDAVNEAAKINILDNLDAQILAVYANACSKYLSLEKVIRTSGVVLDGKRVNPYVNAQDKYAKQIMNCSIRLGIASVDRLRLKPPETDVKPVNKFLKFFEDN